MKKQFLLTAAVILFSLGSASAQCTPDNSITEPGYYPAEFDPAVVGENYSQVLQIRVIKDTNIIYNGFPVTATIDSINLKEIIGLPNTFSYTCYNATCSFVPTKTGCATLTGTAVQADVGTHPLELVVKIYARVVSIVVEQDDTLRDQFALVVSETGNAKVVSKEKGSHFFPNPSSSGVFETVDAQWNNSAVKVFNATGQLVRKSNLNGRQLDISDLPAGMYTYILTNKNDLQSVGRLMSTRH